MLNANAVTDFLINNLIAKVAINLKGTIGRSKSRRQLKQTKSRLRNVRQPVG